jgi:hypothetical protein
MSVEAALIALGTVAVRTATKLWLGDHKIAAEVGGAAVGFDYDYRQLVARKLDHVEMFGVTLADASRRYPLSVAYISLMASADELSPAHRVEELLEGARRVFIRGEAGLGKTTLLQWVAVRSGSRCAVGRGAQRVERLPGGVGGLERDGAVLHPAAAVRGPGPARAGAVPGRGRQVHRRRDAPRLGAAQVA